MSYLEVSDISRQSLPNYQNPSEKVCTLKLSLADGNDFSIDFKGDTAVEDSRRIYSMLVKELDKVTVLLEDNCISEIRIDGKPVTINSILFK